MIEAQNLIVLVSEIGLLFFGAVWGCVVLDIWAQRLSERRCRLAARAEVETYLRSLKRL